MSYKSQSKVCFLSDRVSSRDEWTQWKNWTSNFLNGIIRTLWDRQQKNCPNNCKPHKHAADLFVPHNIVHLVSEVATQADNRKAQNIQVNNQMLFSERFLFELWPMKRSTPLQIYMTNYKQRQMFRASRKHFWRDP